MTMTMIGNAFFRLYAQSLPLIDGAADVPANPGDFVNKFTTVGIALGVVVAVVLISTAGYKMMSSRGEAKGIQDAQEQIQNAIMGFLLILLAVAGVRIILGAFGLAGLVGL